MRRVRWADKAIRDLLDVKAELSEIGPDVTRTVLVRIDRAALWLAGNPKAVAATGYRDWRKLVVKQTGRAIVFRPEPNGIVVLHVRHARSDWNKA